jgi:hypothetical protein
VAVDNGGFVVIVAVDLFSVSPDRRTGPACDHADGLAATALSSLPGDA